MGPDQQTDSMKSEQTGTIPIKILSAVVTNSKILR